MYQSSYVVAEGEQHEPQQENHADHLGGDHETVGWLAPGDDFK